VGYNIKAKGEAGGEAQRLPGRRNQGGNVTTYWFIGVVKQEEEA